MRKLALAFMSSCLLSLPAMAHKTNPNDMVGVNVVKFDSEGAIELENKRYFKPWKQIKLHPGSVNELDSIIAKIKGDSGSNADFKIVYISVVDNQLSRALVLSNVGSAYAIDMYSKKYCGVTIDGNGLMLASDNCKRY